MYLKGDRSIHTYYYVNNYGFVLLLKSFIALVLKKANLNVKLECVCIAVCYEVPSNMTKAVRLIEVRIMNITYVQEVFTLHLVFRWWNINT